MGLFGSSKEIVPTRPGLVLTPGRRFDKAMEKADAALAAEMDADEYVLCYAVCMTEDFTDHVVAVTDRRILVARKNKVRARRYGEHDVRATQLRIRGNGQWMLSVEPRGPGIGLLIFEEEQPAQMVCGQIDARLSA